MKRWSLFLVVVGLSGCSSMVPMNGADRAAETRIQKWQERRESGKARDNLQEIDTFLSERSSPRYQQAARLERAMALLDDGRIAESEKTFRSVRETSLGREPALVARAEWGLSFTSEKQGDDFRSLAHVMSAENMSLSLPAEIGKVELPVRKALILQKLGKSSEAAVALRKADQGLREVLSDPKTNYNPDWMARLNYQMGSALSGEVTEENFQGLIQAQRFSQVYLLKSMASAHPVWAPKALEALRKNYAGFWQFLIHAPTPSGVDLAVAQREKRQWQIPRLAEFLETLESAQAYAPVRGDMANSWQKNFHALVDDLRDKTRAVLYSSSETTILTEESRLLNGLRRGGGPSKTPVTTPANKDPNL